MRATSLFDGFAFDALPLFENGRCSAEVDIGRCDIVQALVVSAVVILLDELRDAVADLAVVVLKQDPGFSSSGDIAQSCPASSGGKAGRGYG